MVMKMRYDNDNIDSDKKYENTRLKNWWKYINILQKLGKILYKIRIFLIFNPVRLKYFHGLIFIQAILRSNYVVLVVFSKMGRK